MRILCAGGWSNSIEPQTPNSDRILGQTLAVVNKLSLLGQKDIHVAIAVDKEPSKNPLETLTDHFIYIYPEKVDPKITDNLKTLDQNLSGSRDYGNLLTSDHVETVIKEVRPNLVYIDNVGGLKLLDLGLTRILKVAHECSAVTFVSVGNAINGYRFLTSAFLHIDFIYCRISEARSITGFTQASRAAKALTAGGAGISIVTKDHDGISAHDGYTLIEMPAFNLSESQVLGQKASLLAGILNGILESGLSHDQLHHPPVNILKNALLLGLAAEKMEAEYINTKQEFTLNNFQKIVDTEGGAILKATKTTKLVP
jgi:hypothetical protein